MGRGRVQPTLFFQTCKNECCFEDFCAQLTIHLNSSTQFLACILFHYQCGICPCKCFLYDHNGMCWGCVCCRYQIDPCFLPRQFVNCFCAIIPCGCIGKELIFTACCCNPGQATMGADDAAKVAELAKNPAKDTGSK